nr:hypothetical protein TDPV-211 [Oriental turtle dovepox virus]
MDVSYFRSKLIDIKTKLDDNERSLISDSNNRRKLYIPVKKTILRLSILLQS